MHPARLALLLCPLACAPEGDAGLERGVYDVEVLPRAEGCDAPRLTAPYRERVQVQPTGGVTLPLRNGPVGDPERGPSIVVESHQFDPVPDHPGRYAAATRLGPPVGDCGRWDGVFDDAVFADGRITVDVELAWRPDQPCPDVFGVPTVACTSELRYTFTLAEACPDGCDFDGLGTGLRCVCP